MIFLQLILNFFAHFFAGIQLELSDANVEVILLQQAGAHALHFDNVAQQIEIDRLIDTIAHHGDFNRAVFRAAHQVDRFV